MKRMMTLALAALMALAIALPASAGHKDDHNPPGQDKVTICHFPGHEGDTDVTGAGNGCRNAGGVAKELSRKAAENGHGVEDATPAAANFTKGKKNS